MFPLDSGKLWHFVRASREKSPCASPCPTPPLLTITPFPHLNAPLSAAVESDVVGYTTITTDAGWNMLGVNFDGLEKGADGQPVPVSFNDVLSGDFSENDQIQCFKKDGTGFGVYRYSGGEWWVRRGVSADTEPIESGAAFWLKTELPTVVTIKGSVCKENAEFSSELPGYYQLIALNAPFDFKVNGTNVSWTGLKTDDQIQYMDSQTGNLTILRYNERTAKWMKSRSDVADVTIPMGASFWLSVQNEDVKFSVSPKATNL